MEPNTTQLAEIIAEARQAILAGDKDLASALAEQAYLLDPKNIDALLLKAGSAEPEAAIPFLNAALAIDPAHPVAREAMAATALALRKTASESWKPEETAELQANPAPVIAPAKRRPSYVLPLVVALSALALVGLFKLGVFKVNAENKVLGFIPALSQNKVAEVSASSGLAPEAFSTASALLTAEVKTSGAGVQAAQMIPTVEVYLPIINSDGSTKTEAPATTAAPAATKPEATPVPPSASSVDPALPVIQITPMSAESASPGKITSVVVTAESGEGEIEPEEEGIDDEIPVIEIAEVPADIAAEYVFVEPQPVVSYGEKWLDLDLSNQMLYAYEGDTLVNSFLVSTGTARTPTVTGTFRIYVKYLYADMRGDDYNLPNVPYTMYFYEGYGIHGTYWHHNFGTPMSHGCVNMETSQAGWVYEWAPVGTIVNVHY